MNLDDPISELHLSTRPRKRLELMGIKTIGDLLEISAYKILMVPGAGRKSLREIDEALRKIGFELKGWRC